MGKGSGLHWSWMGSVNDRWKLQRTNEFRGLPGGTAMKEETPEKIVKSYCQHIREEIAQWKDINQNGCNDPF